MKGRSLSLALPVLAAISLSSSGLAKASNDQYAQFDPLDDEITDAFTKLTWKRDVEAPLDFGTWVEAGQRCSFFGPAYRLPTVKELQTLVDEQPTQVGTTLRYLDPDAFPAETSNVSAPYWSETRESSTNYYVVDFQTGASLVQDKETKAYVRCVKGPT